MKTYGVKLTGWEGQIVASGIEEARYNVKKVANLLNVRVLWVGEVTA